MSGTILIGMLLGMLSSGVQVVLQERERPCVVIVARLIGGLLGGLFAAISVGSTEIVVKDVVLILLAGYVAADLFAFIVFGGEG